MAHSNLMQRLLALTKLAHSAQEKKALPKEFSEQQFFNRRSFLEMSGKAALAATMLAGCNKLIDAPAGNINELNNNIGGTLQPNIAIVGAGIAGLNAAFILKKAGIKATLYDANTRAGGRILSAQNIMGAGLSTEFGGEFIDSGHYDMRLLAKQFNLPLIDLYSPDELELKQNLYFFNGIMYSDDDFLNAITLWLPVVKRDKNSLSDVITYTSYSPTDKKFDNMSIEEYFNSIHLNGWLRSLFSVAYIGEYGLNLDESNAINFLFLVGTSPEGDITLYGQSDERFRVSGGNQRIVDALANALKEDINLGCKLVKLQQKTQGYELYFENKSQPVKADIVLLTLPFKLLREAELTVDLPKVKRNAINNLSYGNNSKLALGFNARPWRTKYNSVGMCYTDNGAQNFWDNSQLQPGTNGGLTVYLGGDSAIALGNENISYQAAKYLHLINEVYPGIESNYTNKAYRMVWPTFPFSKGSYSAFTVGQYTTIAGSEIETVGNLYFAGEHTSYNYQGFMNGGAVTGRIAAVKILKSLDKPHVTQQMPAVAASTN